MGGESGKPNGYFLPSPKGYPSTSPALSLIHIFLERLPSQEEKEALEARMDAMEAAIRLHSKQIRELKKAQ